MHDDVMKVVLCTCNRDTIFVLVFLDLDSQEVLAADNINLFLDTVDEALRDREYKDFNDSLNTKVKLNLYKSFL